MGETGNSRHAVLAAALVGDALGAPFNGLRHGHVQQLLGGPVEGFLESPVLLPDRPDRNVLPGLHTGLGQRMLAGLAINREDDLGRDPVARVGATLLELAGEGEDEGHRYGSLRHAGRPPRRAITRWKAEYPWEERDYTALKEESEGASCALLGIMGLFSQQSDIPLRLARLTHYRLAAVTAAPAFEAVLRLILTMQPRKREDVLELARRLPAAVREIEEPYEREHLRMWKDLGWGRPAARLSKALEPLTTMLREENDDLAIRTIVGTAQEMEPAHPVTHVQHGFAPASFVWALYRGLGQMSARLAVEDVLNRGGETSLTASLVASLMVARHGAQCLPDEWYDAAPVLSALPSLCSGKGFEDWLSREETWSSAEEAMRAPLREAIRKQNEIDAEKGKTRPAKPKPAQQDESEFAPPPQLWLKPGEEEDPAKKKIIRAIRGKKKVDWKEDRRRENRKGKGPDQENP